MTRTIEAPNKADVRYIAELSVLADEIAQEVLDESLDASRDDLNRLNRIIAGGSLQRDATLALQALGIAFGMVFVGLNKDFDWWMVEDEYGRDPGLRYLETSLILFPQTMLSKRIEDGETFSVPAFYDDLVAQVAAILDGGVS
jgi:hypothetical protein